MKAGSMGKASPGYDLQVSRSLYSQMCRWLAELMCFCYTHKHRYKMKNTNPFKDSNEHLNLKI